MSVHLDMARRVPVVLLLLVAMVSPRTLLPCCPGNACETKHPTAPVEFTCAGDIAACDGCGRSDHDPSEPATDHRHHDCTCNGCAAPCCLKMIVARTPSVVTATPSIILDVTVEHLPASTSLDGIFRPPRA